MEEDQKIWEGEGCKNKSPGIILQNTQKYNTDHITDVTTNSERKEENCRDVSILKIHNNK